MYIHSSYRLSKLQRQKKWDKTIQELSAKIGMNFNAKVSLDRLSLTNLKRGKSIICLIVLHVLKAPEYKEKDNNNLP